MQTLERHLLPGVEVGADADFVVGASAQNMGRAPETAMNQHTSIRNASRSSLKVGFILAREFTLSAFSLFVDTLRLASDVDDHSGRVHCDWSVLSSTRHLIKSSSGIQIAPTAGLRPHREFDYLVVVGGLLTVEEPIDRETREYLNAATADGVKIVGVCTGSFLLASLGLMRHRTTCVSWLHHNQFVDEFPKHSVTSLQLFVEDKNVITCAGGSAVADLAATLVRRHVGKDAERNALEILQIDRRRDGKEIQARKPLGLVGHQDERINIAMMFMEHHLDENVSMREVAAAIGLSCRQMERLFLAQLGATPVSIYMKLRMEKAMALLKRTKKPLIDVALDVGFDSASNFTKRFRKSFGYTPSHVRRTLKIAEGASGLVSPAGT
jgi:transcriptional regulator GlxA family with amidase domain